MKNMEGLRKIYKQKIYQKGQHLVTHLAINMVVNRENFQEVSKLKNFCGKDFAFTVNKPIFLGRINNFMEKYKVDFSATEEKLFNPYGTLKKPIWHRYKFELFFHCTAGI